MNVTNIFRGILSLALAAVALTSCNTSIEALDIIKPEEKSEQYYADLRAYKQRTDHEVFFGWFGGWNTKSPNMIGSLKSVPDSVDIISIWSGTYDREDMEYVQKVKGTRVTFTIFAHKIPAQFLEGENHDQVTREGIERYAMALVDTMKTYGYQGIDLDYEPGYQDPAGGPFTGPLVGPASVYPNYRDNMEIFVKKLGEFVGPKSGTSNLLIIDGVPSLQQWQLCQPAKSFQQGCRTWLETRTIHLRRNLRGRKCSQGRCSSHVGRRQDTCSFARGYGPFLARI